MAGIGGSPSSALAGESGVASSWAGDAFNKSNAMLPGLTSFFTNEMYNPQGFGPQTLTQMMTQAGQSTAGALGAAKKTGMDMASRTGNLSAIPQVEDSAGKAAIDQMSNSTNSINLQNAMEKMSQQQSGVSGLTGLYKDLSGQANSYLQDSIEAQSDRAKAMQEEHADKMSDISTGVSLAGALATGGASALASGGLGGFLGGFGGQAGG